MLHRKIIASRGPLDADSRDATAVKPNPAPFAKVTVRWNGCGRENKLRGVVANAGY
jgi:hypothetical protein